MILSIAASILHRLEYLNGYFAEDDDEIYSVVQSYLSTVLVDNPLALVHLDPAAVAFVISLVTSIKTLTAPEICECIRDDDIRIGVFKWLFFAMNTYKITHLVRIRAPMMIVENKNGRHNRRGNHKHNTIEICS